MIIAALVEGIGLPAVFAGAIEKLELDNVLDPAVFIALALDRLADGQPELLDTLHHPGFELG